jgi:hypothetical protein
MYGGAERQFYHIPATSWPINGAEKNFIWEIVFKVILEVISMEERNAREGGMSGSSRDFSESKEFSGEERSGHECYTRCMDDAWDLKGESICSSSCGI